MSIQIGTYHFDGQKASRREVALLLQGTEKSGPDYSGTHVCASLGMGFRGYNIAPEDTDDQPLVGSSGVVVTFDGRLDNRDELARRLGFCGNCTLSDGALVVGAFETLGPNTFELLAGEYACVLWDEVRRSLFLARSRCGTRQLFYTIDSSTITWSSEIDHLVLKTSVDPVVNDDYAVGYLYYQPDIDESPFRDVAVVQCGTYLEVKSSGEARAVIKTWHPQNITLLKLSSDGEYEEAWREQVEGAVTSRLRAKHAVFCELSGGLDSSTVALIGDEVLKKSGRDPSMLTTVSCTYEKSKSCDETAFIKAVEQSRGSVGISVTEISQQATLGLNDIEFTGVPNTGHCCPGRYRVTEQRMKQAGARVLLTGIGGDHLFWSDHTGTPELADLLSRGRLIATISKGRKWSQAAAIPLWQVLASSAIGPITVAHRLLHWHPRDINLRSWITDDALRSINGRGRTQALRINSEIRLPSLRVRVHTLRSLSALISAGYFQEFRGIYFSHPFAHSGLIDFVLSLPMDQVARPGEDRSLMRRATRGLLPEKVRTRKSKGSIDEMLCRAVEREQSTIGPAADLEVCRRGYAEPTALTKAIRQVSLGRLEQTYALVRLFSLERWLRSLGRISSQRLALKKSSEAEAFRSSGIPMSLSG
jgi:asparagine synthase (glutamine-hydrolysing)